MRRPGANRRGIRGFGGVPAVFDPSDEASAVVDLWALSAQLTLSTLLVETWATYKGTGPDFTKPSDARRPDYEASTASMNGRETVHFDIGQGEILTAADGTVAEAGSFVVITALDQLSTPTAAQYFFDFELGRLICELSNGTTADLGFFESGHQAIAAAATGAQILRWTFTVGGNCEIFRDGVSLGTSAYSGTDADGAIGIGGEYDGVGKYADAKVGRHMMFSGIDAARDARVEAWMSDYYGIALP
jgi:hypothetical protein